MFLFIIKIYQYLHTCITCNSSTLLYFKLTGKMKNSLKEPDFEIADSKQLKSKFLNNREFEITKVK